MTTPDETPFTTLAQGLTEALAARYASTGSYSPALAAVFKGRESPLATATFEGVTIHAGGAAERFRVTPHADLDARARGRWTKAVAAWTKSPAWRVTKADGAVLLDRPLTAHALRGLVREHLGEEATEEVPWTFARPIHSGRPLPLDAMRLVASKVVRRQCGAVPIATTRALVEALPGWGWSEGVLARPFSDHVDWHALEARLRRTRRALAFRAGTPLVVYSTGSLTDEDHAAFHATVDACAPNLVDDAPLGADVAEGTFLAHGSHDVVDAPVPQGQRPVLWGTGHVVRVVPRLWRATFARVVRAPNGDTYPLYRHRPWHGGRPEESYDGGFWAWAYAHGLGELAEGVLAGSDEVFLRRAMSTTVRTLDHTGECQICARVQKMKLGAWPVMVDHGYNYPHREGYRGGRLGDRMNSCGGVGYRPYELAHDALDLEQAQLVLDVEQAARLFDATRTKEAARAEPVSVSKQWITHADEDRFQWVEVAPEDPAWPEFMARILARQEAHLRSLRGRLAWVTKRIETWTLRPLYGASDDAPA